MKIFIILLVAIAHQTVQTSISGLSFSQIVKLFHESDIEFEELESDIGFVLETFENIVEKLADEINDQCNRYLSVGLEELDQLLHATNPTNPTIPIFQETYEKLSSEINDCHDIVDNTVSEANEKFFEILKKADVFVGGLKILKLDDTYENYLHFKNQFELIIIPTLTDYLKNFRYNSIFLPLKLKLCVQSITQRVSLDILVILYAEVLNNMDLDSADIIHIVMENTTHHVLEMTNTIENKCSSYIQVGLSTVKHMPNFGDTLEKYYDLISSKIYDCANKSDAAIDGAKTDFFKIIMESLSLDAEQIDSDELIDVFRQKHNLKIPHTLNSFLQQLRYDSISVPSDVKKCVEEFVYLSTLELKPYAAR